MPLAPTPAAYAAISTGWPPLASTGASAAAVTAPPTTDQLRRLLRQAHAFQPQPAGRDGVAMELARLTLLQVRGGTEGNWGCGSQE